MAQPVAGTGKAGETGSGQNQGQGQAMEGTGAGLEEFLNTSRTGRRNAVPDIGEEKATFSTSELTLDMAKLSCAEDGGQPSGQTPQASSKASKSPS